MGRVIYCCLELLHTACVLACGLGSTAGSTACFVRVFRGHSGPIVKTCLDPHARASSGPIYVGHTLRESGMPGMALLGCLVTHIRMVGCTGPGKEPVLSTDLGA